MNAKKEYLILIYDTLTDEFLSAILKKPHKHVKDLLDQSEAIQKAYSAANDQERRLLNNYCMWFSYGIKLVRDKSAMAVLWSKLETSCGKDISKQIFTLLTEGTYPELGLDELLPADNDALKNGIHALEIMLRLMMFHGIGCELKEKAWNFVNELYPAAPKKSDTIGQSMLGAMFENRMGGSTFAPRTESKVPSQTNPKKADFFKPAYCIANDAKTIFNCFEAQKGESPAFKDLLMAFRKGNAPCINKLLSNSCSIKSANIYGATALHFAIYYDCLNCIDEKLIKKYLDPQREITIGKNRYNAMDLAVFLVKHDHVIEKLETMFPSVYEHVSKGHYGR